MDGRADRRQRGFSLIELLMVVAIIGIVAALAIPNLIGAIQRSRQSRSMADIRMISEGIEAYQTDYSYYPVVPDGEVADLHQGIYLLFIYIFRSDFSIIIICYQYLGRFGFIISSGDIWKFIRCIINHFYPQTWFIRKI